MLLPSSRPGGYSVRVADDDVQELEQAEILGEYGPYPEAPAVHGVSYDGQVVWLAVGERLLAVTPDSGELVRALDAPAQAGTAFDGHHLYQLAGGAIYKLERATGRVLAKLAAPAGELSGMAWAEGYLWIAEYAARKIHQVDPETGSIVRTLQSDRFVTGVTWVQGELWHGAQHDTQPNELREIAPQSGAVRRRVALPAGMRVSGLESDGADRFFCGGGSSGKLRAVRRSRRRG